MLVAEPGTPYVYGIVPAGLAGAYGRLDRLDLITGKISRGPPVFGGAQLIPLGSSVGVLEPLVEEVGPDGSPINSPIASHQVLHLVGPGGLYFGVGPVLRAAGRIVTPLVVASTGTSGAMGLWVAVSGRLLSFDPATGSLERSLRAPPGSVTAVVVIPTGTAVCVSTVLRSEPSEPVSVDELDTRSGRVLAHHRFGPGMGGYTTAATNDGVWVAAGSGMIGWTELMLGPELVARNVEVSPVIRAAYGAVVTLVISDAAWLVDPRGIACASPSTGVVYTQSSLSEAPVGNFHVHQPLAVVGAELYAVRQPYAGADSGEVLAIKPSGCHLSAAAGKP